MLIYVFYPYCKSIFKLYSFLRAYKGILPLTPHFSNSAGYFLPFSYLTYGRKKSLGNLLPVPAVDILLFICVLALKGLAPAWWDNLTSDRKLFSFLLPSYGSFNLYDRREWVIAAGEVVTYFVIWLSEMLGGCWGRQFEGSSYLRTRMVRS